MGVVSQPAAPIASIRLPPADRPVYLGHRQLGGAELDNAAILVRSPLLRGAAPGTVARLAEQARLQAYARGSTLFIEGEPARAFGIVAAGAIKLYRMSPGGTETVVRVFSLGESFAEAVALRRGNYPVSAAAVTDCSVLWLDAERLRQLFLDDPEIALAILASTFVHLHDLVNQVEQLKSRKSVQRVAGFLAELAGGASGPCTVTLPYDKVLIAGELGIKPESLSRTFARLRDHGVTIRANEADIADVTLLRGLAQSEPD